MPGVGRCEGRRAAGHDERLAPHLLIDCLQRHRRVADFVEAVQQRDNVPVDEDLGDILVLVTLPKA